MGIHRQGVSTSTLPTSTAPNFSSLNLSRNFHTCSLHGAITPISAARRGGEQRCASDISDMMVSTTRSISARLYHVARCGEHRLVNVCFMTINIISKRKSSKVENYTEDWERKERSRNKTRRTSSTSSSLASLPMKINGRRGSGRPLQFITPLFAHGSKESL